MSKLKESTKLYKHADDKNVANYIVHSNGTNVFYDEGKTTKVSFEDLKELFVKGMLVKNTTGLFVPIAMKEDSTEVTITIYDGTTKTDLKSNTKQA